MIPRLDNAFRYIIVYDTDKVYTGYIDRIDIGYYYVKKSRKAWDIKEIAIIDIVSISYSNKNYGDIIWKAS